ncbi:MAG: AAA family ATPase [Eggerthellaceae bacterium]|nr:AAA family ATPase [Eggerthellaceae bacterium]
MYATSARSVLAGRDFFPMRHARHAATPSEATGFLKRWLTGALKGTVDLRPAALTGVQRVGKESIFSDLNSFVVDTALNHEYAEAFGFTRPEVVELLARLGHSDKAAELAEWYDGYDFGGEAVCNPWSVLNYFRQGCVAQPYWTNTSSNSVVKSMHAAVACAPSS